MIEKYSEDVISNIFEDFLVNIVPSTIDGKTNPLYKKIYRKIIKKMQSLPSENREYAVVKINDVYQIILKMDKKLFDQLSSPYKEIFKKRDGKKLFREELANIKITKYSLLKLDEQNLTTLLPKLNDKIILSEEAMKKLLFDIDNIIKKADELKEDIFQIQTNIIKSIQ